MKKIGIILTITVLVTLASVLAVWACPTNIPFSNLASPTTYFYGHTDATRTNIGGAFWVPGAGDVTIGLGKDNGQYRAVVNTTSTQDWTSGSTSSGVPYIIIAGTWSANATYPTDDCPVTATDPMTVLLYEQVGDGTAGHTGKFVAATAPYVAANSRYNYSRATTPTNDKQFQPIPTPIISSTDYATKTVGISWTQPAAGASQYYDSALAAPTVITHYELFYALGSAPTTGNVASWTSYGQVAYGAAQPVSMTIGAWDPATQALYVAMRPVFDKYARAPGFTIPFVGANSAQIGPTAAGVFGAFNAAASGTTINVNWTSNNEAGVTGYQVYSATASNGPWQATGSAIAPAGNGHAYSTSFAVPGIKASGTVYVKIKASKTGGDEWTTVKKVPYGLTTAPAAGVNK